METLQEKETRLKELQSQLNQIYSEQQKVKKAILDEKAIESVGDITGKVWASKQGGLYIFSEVLDERGHGYEYEGIRFGNHNGIQVLVERITSCFHNSQDFKEKFDPVSKVNGPSEDMLRILSVYFKEQNNG